MITLSILIMPMPPSKYNKKGPHLRSLFRLVSALRLSLICCALSISVLNYFVELINTIIITKNVIRFKAINTVIGIKNPMTIAFPNFKS